MNCSKHKVKLICPVCEGEKPGAKGGKKAAQGHDLYCQTETGPQGGDVEMEEERLVQYWYLGPRFRGIAIELRPNAVSLNKKTVHF
jgi:hypothetical protein